MSPCVPRMQPIWRTTAVSKATRFSARGTSRDGRGRGRCECYEGGQLRVRHSAQEVPATVNVADRASTSTRPSASARLCRAACYYPEHPIVDLLRRRLAACASGFRMGHLFASRETCASGFRMGHLFASRETCASGFRVNGVSVSHGKATVNNIVLGVGTPCLSLLDGWCWPLLIPWGCRGLFGRLVSLSADVAAWRPAADSSRH